MNRILYVSACVRENSRTLRLAKELLTHLDGEITEVDLNSDKPEFLDRGLLEKREKLLKERDFSDRMFRFARDFSTADEIVVAAPYWDLSIPAILKCYFENVSIPGLTFSYTDDGRVVGLCRAVRLWFVTTVGAKGLPFDYGYGYIKDLCRIYYGIEDVRLVYAEGTDLVSPEEAERIVERAAKSIEL